MTQRHDAIHHPDIGPSVVDSERVADALGQLAAKAIQLLFTAELHPQLHFIALLIGPHVADNHAIGGQAQASGDFSGDHFAYLLHALGRPEIVDEDHRRAMVASPPDVSAVLDALYHGRRDEAERLVRQDSLSLSIHEAAAMGVLGRVQALVDADASQVHAFAPDGFQPLGLAAFFGHTQVAELLLAHGADPNTPSRNAQGVNALHAALAGPTPDLACPLLEAGADVNARQQSGVTPLHEAAHIGRADLVRLLLEHGADVDARDDQGRGAADFAREGGHTSVLEALG